MQRSRLMRRVLPPALLFFLLLAPGYTQEGESPRDLYESGLDALQGDRLYEAVEAFSAAVDANPGYAEAHIGLARAYGRLGELDQAHDHATRARELAPLDPDSLNTLAEIRIDLGNLEGARDLYDTVLRRAPNNQEARLGLAELSVATGDFDQAMERYEAVRRSAPRNRRALLSLALLWEQRGDRDVAERYLELAIRHHSDSPQVHLEAARYYLRRSSPDGARRHAQIALQIRPDLPDARRVLASVAYSQEDYATARQAAEELLSNDQRDETAWYIHSLAQYRLGDVDAALQSYRRALRLVPDAELLRLAYEDVLLELPADHEARREAAVYHFEEGRYFQEQNLFGRARAAYRRGLLLNPFDVDGRLAFAELYRFGGLEGKYLNELEVISSLSSDVPRDIEDRIEVYSSLLEESVSTEWGVDQFTISREPLEIALYIRGGDGMSPRPEESRILAEALRRELLGYEMIDVPGEPVMVGTFAEAFSDARRGSADYFLMLDFESSDRAISVSAGVYVARTGTEVAEVRTGRSGADRLARSLVSFSEAFVTQLPLAGTILERQGRRLLVNIGEIHGIAEEAPLVIVRPEAMLLAGEAPVYTFTDAEVLGTATVTRLDDLVSEATLARPGLFDLVRKGDRVILDEDRQAPPGETERFPVLYERVRSTR
ncbi:MAG: tetratricopeptide repeat protein [Spirochaetaceae bacterium]